MDSKITYNQTIEIIQKLNEFIEEMDNKIISTQNNYDKKMARIIQEHLDSNKKFESECNSQLVNVQENQKKMIQEAHNIKKKIEKIDKHLSEVDKYYQKTKNKKSEILNGQKSKKYTDNEDYFEILKQIQSDFAKISDKYSTDILPSVINGLNFVFSTKRKKDYEELIILQNTVDSFIEEIENDLKELTDDTIKEMKEGYSKQKENLKKSQEEFKEQITEEYNNILLNIAEEIEIKFNKIMPEMLINNIANNIEQFRNGFGKVNSSTEIYNNELYLGCIDFPIDAYVQSNTLKSYILEKCSKIIVNGVVKFIYSLDLEKTSNVFLSYNEKNTDLMQKFMHNTMWNFLSTIPVIKSNIIVADCDKKGSSILPFLNFKKEIPDIFDENIYTNEESITRRLQKLNEQIDDTIQNKLVNRFKNIIEYNKNAPTRADSLTLLTIFDFPAGFDSRNIEYLINIMKNGGKCGIYTIIAHNTDIEFNGYSKPEELLNKIVTYCSTVKIDKNYTLLPYYLNLGLEDELDYEKSNNFMEQYKVESEAIKNKSLSFDDILDKELFTRNSAKKITIPVGVGDGESIVSMSFGGSGSSHHALIAGATGSGKSTLLHTLIMSAMLSYSPDDLNLYLMDFKGGTEFKIYDSFRLPHIKLIALDAMQEFGESILENLVSEIEKRSIEFKNENVSKLAEYIDVTGRKMPRILIIMDEFQILFNDATNRKVANHCAELVKRIVTEGRSYGIHLLMATQSTKIIGGLTIEKGTIEQMRIRVGLKCGESDAMYLFGDNNYSKGLEMMKGPIGTAVLNQEYTEDENVGFRVAYCDDEKQEKYLKRIEETYKSHEVTTQSFEGQKVNKLLDAIEYNAFNSETEIQIGDLIKVAPPFKVVFNKKKKYNTLICGTNEKMLNNILHLYILGTLLNKNNDIYCIDAEKIIEEEYQNPYYEQYKRFGNRFEIANSKGDIISILNEIYEFYLEAKKESPNRQKFIFIRNFEYLDILKQMIKGDRIDENEYMEENKLENETSDDDDLSAEEFAAKMFDFGTNNSSSEKKNTSNINVSKKLINLIEDGASYGIHFIFTSMEFQSVKECMKYGGNILDKFTRRYVFSLNDNDAEYLIDGVNVSSLNKNTVYYTDTIKNTFQVKPYIFPEVEELDKFISEIGI